MFADTPESEVTWGEFFAPVVESVFRCFGVTLRPEDLQPIESNDCSMVGFAVVGDFEELFLTRDITAVWEGESLVEACESFQSDMDQFLEGEFNSSYLVN